MEGGDMWKAKDERGVALILVLGLMLAIAVVAVIVTLLAITERGLTASERQQRAAFEGAQAAVEMLVVLMPEAKADSGVIAALPNGIVAWNGDPSDSVPGKHQLNPPGIASPPGMEYNVFAYRRYDVRGAGRFTRSDGVIVANKGVRATVDVGPFVIPSATAE
jgi:uncharacterized protein (DUF58 family)